ncbi:MAG TPA: putative ABC transporter permease [Candidatus Onthousia faecigallinarum]|nr:putative ABC transporter permease [Candidatus Onthousia faecigallinarum]
MKEKFKNYIHKDYTFDKSTWVGIFCLIIVFAGVFGFLYEFIFYYFNSGMKQFYYRGGNFLPWINIYAIGAVLIFLFTYKERKNPLFVFLVSVITSGVLEYIGGFIMEHIMKVKCWDYSKEILSFGNINGYVCLRSVLVFGISSLLLIYVLVPFCFFLAHRMKKKHFLIFSYTLCAIFLFDELYNLIFARLFSLPRASEFYKKLGVPYIYFNQ